VVRPTDETTRSMMLKNNTETPYSELSGSTIRLSEFACADSTQAPDRLRSLERESVCLAASYSTSVERLVRFFEFSQLLESFELLASQALLDSMLSSSLFSSFLTRLVC
jgi:hypothetical protein